MSTTLKSARYRALNTREDVRAWFVELVGDGISFHPDNSGNEYVHAQTGARTFTDAQAAQHDKMMCRAHELLGDEIYVVGLAVLEVA